MQFSYEYQTPLHKAAHEGNTNLAEMLISSGEDINRQGWMKETPLHRVAWEGHTKMAALLIENGADINRQGWMNETPLHMAAWGGHTELAELLILNGADIHSKDNNNQTPLHRAARGGHTNMAALLISMGADIHRHDWQHQTPLHLAAWRGSTELVALLILNGADINSQDIKQKTALDMAHQRTKILLKLIESGVEVSQALEAAKHCNSLMEAQKYIQSTPHSVANLSSNLDHGVQQLEQDVILSGMVDAKEFKSLLKLGTYESYGNRIYLAGACSVGKSTLACLLIGDEIPLEWKSTDGLKIFFGRNGIHLEERKMVPLDKDKGNTNILSSVLRGQPDIDESQQDMKQIQHDMEKWQLEESSSLSELDNNGAYQEQHSPVSKSMESKQEENVAAHSLMSNVPEKQETLTDKKTMQEKKKPVQKRLGFNLIHEGIKAEIQKGEYKVKIAPSDLVDFGGQKSYDMTHQLFIQGKGTFTLMFDGRKGLRDPLPEYPQGDITTESIMKHWVDSILTYCGEDDDDILPIILFVATHRDKLTQDKQLERMTEFKKGLKDIFQNQDHQQRIKYDDIFFINSTDEKDPEVNRLQTTYVEIAFQQKSWGKRMPMAWVPMELQMSEMRANNINIISKDDLVEINNSNADLALSDSQLDQFLKVQHSLGKIMYFKGQGLEKYIIVQPITLVDILRSFITDRMFWPSDRNLNTILQAMTHTGKIKKVDLFKLWSQDEFNQLMPQNDVKEFVVQILVYLDLLVKPKRKNVQDTTHDFYLVPCMAQRLPTANFGENLDEERTICLSYKLLKSSIPTALSYKLIGAALNVWPLQETEKGVSLYHKAAILCIDKANELHILVKEDRVIVYLLHENSKHFISPDVASCAQECLTLTLMTTLEFYHNSFGKLVSKCKIAELFEIEIGEKCDKEICFISILQAQNNTLWICKSGKQHATKYPLYWTYDKKQDECKKDCTGLETKCLEYTPTDKHLIRLADQIGVKQFDKFVIQLGLSRKNWEQIEYKHQTLNMTGMKFDALSEVEKNTNRPLFNDLNSALINCDYNNHILCQVFREDRTILDIDNLTLQDIPDNDTLYGLSRNIGNCAIHLGVELDVKFQDIEETIVRYNKDMFDQNYDILMKWKAFPGGNKTIRNLMHALWIVDRRGCTFLKDKYDIKY